MSKPSHYRVRMDGGDGYCPFFATPQTLQRVHEGWFPERLGEWGRASLFRIVEGTCRGDYVAFTSGSDPEDWLLTSGSLPGVAHHIRNPGTTFKAGDADPCGKSHVKLVKD